MIRKMKSTDINRVMDIWLSTNLEAHPFIDPNYWYQNLSNVQNAIQQAEVYCSVSANDRIQGFIGLQENYIAGLFIAKEYQSQRLGTKLLNVAKGKHQQLILDVYLENQRAIKFYQQNGFQITNRNNLEAEMTWLK